MNNTETIIALRNQGFSYGKIAKKLGISRSTVQSLCRRNNVEKEEQDHKLYTFCLTCNKKLNQKPKQKKKKFCSDTCRFKYWNNHKNQMSAAKENTCINCGNKFYSYGKRKHCSHKCYINYRFKRGDAA